MKTVLYSATDVNSDGYIAGFNGDGYVANAILYSTFAVSNFLAPWVISNIGPKYVHVLFPLNLLDIKGCNVCRWVWLHPLFCPDALPFWLVRMHFVSYLVSHQMWTNVILRPYQSPTRLLYGSAILNGMGAALLWTSQVQTNITDVQKNTLPLTGKVSGAKSNNSDVQKYFYSYRENFLPSTQSRTQSGATLVSSGFSIRWVESWGRPLFWCFFAMWTWLTRLAF